MDQQQARSGTGPEEKKSLVITGASRGIGKAIAELFAAHGYDLLLCSLDPARLESTAGELRTRYPRQQVAAKAADLSEKSQAAGFGHWVLDQLARNGKSSAPEILVNNAGYFLPGELATEEEGLLEKMMKINLYSAYHLTRTLLPSMIARGRGHIFNICSIASLQAYPGGGSYSISKAALASFSKNLRLELKPSGIKVTAVYPGAVYTDSWAGSGIPSGRMMSAGDIAQAVYLASCLSPGAVMEEIILRPLAGDL